MAQHIMNEMADVCVHATCGTEVTLHKLAGPAVRGPVERGMVGCDPPVSQWQTWLERSRRRVQGLCGHGQTAGN